MQGVTMTLHPIRCRWLWAALLWAVVLAGCAVPGAQTDPSAWRRSVQQQLRGNLALPLTARLQPMPADLLTTVQRQDRTLGIGGVGGYVTRPATAHEQALFDDYLQRLPPVYGRIFTDKLLGVFIVDEFAGAGLTEWVVDGDGRVYYYLILNGALFERSLDDWLSYKEDSLFDRTAGPTLRVTTGTAYRALLYGLLHEGAHIVDYELGVTPYVEQEHAGLLRRSVAGTPFTAGIWVGQRQPQARYDFAHRTELNIYGIFTQRGQIARMHLADMFAQLRRTPFAGFYSGVSWNEHLADYLTNHHLETALGARIEVELVQDGQVLARHQPARTPQAQALVPTMQVFYRTD